MLIKIELLTLISKKDLITAYFFERDNKIILSKDYATNKKDCFNDTNFILNLLKAETLCAEISGKRKKCFLHIVSASKEIIKVVAPLNIVVKLAHSKKIPIFIEHEDLYKDGIMVTKELIEGTLQH